MKHILVIDDNEDVRKIIGYDLLKAGFAVDDAEDGISGFAQATKTKYDLIIIDWMMPGMNGLELTRALRARNVRSILFMLTAKDGDNDLEEAFAAGVDDYLRKPFSPRELQIRIRKHLQGRPAGDEAPKTILRYQDLTLDERSRRFFISGKEISLTRKEFDLMDYFMQHAQTVLSRNEILNAVWGFDYDGDTRIIDVHTFKLRGKLSSSKSQITSSRGIGYILEPR